MKNKLLLIVLISAFNNTVWSQNQSHIIYNAKGKKVSYKKMLKTASKSDVVLFGELHYNPISHWLQYELTKDLFEVRSLVMGAEMIEADNQPELNSYLINEISQQELDSLARLWKNHKTDYAPLVNFAKKKKVPFIATNVPRRYANLVFKKGFNALDSLSELEKSWIAPLPIRFDSELSTYKEILKMMGSHGTLELVKAQAIKDATMAYFIQKNIKENHLFIHYNGAYHSNNYEGILWYLKRLNSKLNYSTLSTVSQKNIHKLKEENIDLYTMLNFEMVGVPMVNKDHSLYLTGYELSNLAEVSNTYANKNLVVSSEKKE